MEIGREEILGMCQTVCAVIVLCASTYSRCVQDECQDQHLSLIIYASKMHCYQNTYLVRMFSTIPHRGHQFLSVPQMYRTIHQFIDFFCLSLAIYNSLSLVATSHAIFDNRQGYQCKC